MSPNFVVVRLIEPKGESFTGPKSDLPSPKVLPHKIRISLQNSGSESLIRHYEGGVGYPVSFRVLLGFKFFGGRLLSLSYLKPREVVLRVCLGRFR